MRSSFSLRKQPFYSRMLFLLRLHSPKLVTIFYMLVSIAPVYLPGYSAVRPCFTLVPVFYWAVYRPYNFSVISAFFMGLALDFLDGTPLGINTLVFTVFYIAVDGQRRFLLGRSFHFVWFGFAILALFAYFLKWLFISINYSTFTPFGIVFVSYLLLTISYPLTVWPCAKLHIYLLDKEK